jgi:Fe-Mn family superoxide dismutase
MTHSALDFSHLLGELDGLSDAQLEAHFKLYAGYVKKLNEIETALETQDRSATNYSYGAFSELKRREAVAFNGTYLHQMYFENLSGEESAPSADLKAAMESAFGSMEAWEKDVRSSAACTPGWVLLTYSMVDQKVHTYVMYEHHIGLPVHQVPIMALDCWEHAFMIDYGTNKGAYLDAFVKNIDWNMVNMRFEAVTA